MALKPNIQQKGLRQLKKGQFLEESQIQQICGKNEEGREKTQPILKEKRNIITNILVIEKIIKIYYKNLMPIILKIQVKE